MCNQNKLKLFNLSKKNAQRLFYNELLKKAPPTLKEFLESESKIFHPDTPKIIKDAFSRCDLTQQYNEINRSVFETASELKAQKYFEESAEKLANEDCFLMFSQFKLFSHSGEEAWIPDFPIIKTRIEKLIPILNLIFPFSKGQIAILSLNSGKTLIMSNYVGVLYNEPSSKEIVYEVLNFDL